MDVPQMTITDDKAYADHYFTVKVVESLIKDKNFDEASSLIRLSDKEYRTYFRDKASKNAIFVTCVIHPNYTEISLHIGDFETCKNAPVTSFLRCVDLPQADLTTDQGKLYRERMTREALAQIWAIRTSHPGQKRGKMNVGPEVRIELENDPIRGVREVRVFDYSKIKEQRQKHLRASEENANSINYADFKEKFGDKLSDKERIQKLRDLSNVIGNSETTNRSTS